MSWTIIIQARAGSTRLPGKIFKEICGTSILEFQINRLKQMKSQPRLIVATTKSSSDDRTEEISKKCGLACFRGSEDDVLSRYFEAANSYHADPVGRVTSDCPLIDPEVADNLYDFFLDSQVDYVSNTIVRSFPRGLDIEIFSFSALEKAHRSATKLSDREHVTPFIRDAKNGFTHKNLMNNRDYSFHRWTVDTAEDFLLIEKLAIELKSVPRFRMQDVLKIFDRDPSLIKINEHIEQKKN